MLVAIVLIVFLCVVLQSCSVRAPFRLHVIANSDGRADQRVKLRVRDAVLAYCETAMLDCNNKQQALAFMKSHEADLQQVAQETLREEGYSYGAKVTIGEDDFPTKTYGTVTYPQGRYDALRIVLGEGSGQNWWCVMFPPLCIVNTDEIEEGQDVEYSSAIIEWLSGLFTTQPKE